MERLGVENHVFHRSCFKCFTCNTQLKPGSYEYDSKWDRFYCKSHYRTVLRQQTIKRTMEERGITSFEENDTASLKTKKQKKFSQIVTDSPSPESPPSSLGTTVSAAEEPPPPVSEAPSLQDSSEIKAGLPSLLKTLATSKQQKESVLTTNISAGNTPVSSPAFEKKTDAPTDKVSAEPLPSKGTVILSGKERGPTKVVTVSAATQPAGKPELPKSTISWLAKGAKVVPKTDEPPTTPPARASVPEKPQGPPAAKLPSPPVTLPTTIVSMPTKPVSVPRTQPHTVDVRINQQVKDKLKPVQETEKTGDTKIKGAEKKPSEKPAAVEEVPPVKPPRGKGKKEAERKEEEPMKQAKVEKPAVAMPEKPTPTRPAQTRPAPTKPEVELSPQRQPIKPKRAAPPRPSHPPSIRRGARSPPREGTTCSHVCLSVCLRHTLFFLQLCLISAP